MVGGWRMGSCFCRINIVESFLLLNIYELCDIEKFTYVYMYENQLSLFMQIRNSAWDLWLILIQFL